MWRLRDAGAPVRPSLYFHRGGAADWPHHSERPARVRPNCGAATRAPGAAGTCISASAPNHAVPCRGTWEERSWLRGRGRSPVSSGRREGGREGLSECASE